jgi:NAD(P)-dependent dehydrogenase (short-subunit alcohol dehydrogenase family)
MAYARKHGRYDLDGKTALITGAGSGIGQALAVVLGRRGCRLALADVSEKGLDETLKLLGKTAPAVSLHRLDVSDADAVYALPAEVPRDHGALDILINNAGIALHGTFQDMDDEDFAAVLNVNLWGVVRMCRASLPLLGKSSDARIVNISSLFGIIAPPGQTAYVASKYAVRGFTESLRDELSDTPIQVTVVHPGGVATSIAKNGRAAIRASAKEVDRQKALSAKLLKMPPPRAAEIIASGIERRRNRILIGMDAQLFDLGARFAPGLVARIVKYMEAST